MKALVSTTIWLGLLMTRIQAKNQIPLNDGRKTIWPKPECEGCPPRGIDEAPGIGFDLNFGYATAAIKYHNGTVVDVVKQDAPPEYRDMMLRFSPPYVQYGPPFDTVMDQIRYTLDQAQRCLRRLRGLPSTQDIALLASILDGLRITTNAALGEPVVKVLPSTPWLPNLHPEDFNEAFQLAGLELLDSSSYYGTLQQGGAAWAGMGFGLCEHWRDLDICLDEELEMEYKEALLVSFTAEELLVEHLGIWSAYSVAKYGSQRYADLGYGVWRENVQNETFWDLVGEKALQMARVTDRVDELLLVGEYGEEKLFLDALWKALGTEFDVQQMWRPLQTESFSAEFVAARGAAELGRRQQYLGWLRGCGDAEGEASDQELR